MLRSKWPSVGVLALCAVLVLATWLAGAAIIPSLRLEYALTGFQESLLTSSVNAGFVAGTLGSAVLGLADRLDPRRFFMVSAFVGAAANAAMLVVEPSSPAAAVSRFVVGATMAGIYPVGMKVVSTWAKADMGLLTGLFVGALTLGTAAPHLIDVFGGVDWRFTIAMASALSVVAGILVNSVGVGPRVGKTPPFNPRIALEAYGRRSLRLANFGYLGHMWELYAMWAWVGLFLQASFAVAPGGPNAAQYAKIATFAAIGIGSLGCLAGGLFADRLGRTTLTMGAMTVSGLCCLSVGLLFGGNPWLLVVLCLIWGFAVVADSAQFSASIIELSDPSTVGTMITVQTCAGFLLTLATIHLMPALVGALGWESAFVVLVLGPVFGVVSMGRLRSHPEAIRLAGGKR